jgi:hypothetical protein
VASAASHLPGAGHAWPRGRPRPLPETHDRPFRSEPTSAK